MKKNIKYKFIGIICFITCIIIIVIFLIKIGDKFDKTNKQVNSINKEISSTNDIVDDARKVIKSTNEKPIEKEKIEVSCIDILNQEGNLHVTTTLKNNSNEKIEGLYIRIKLLDKKGKTLVEIVENSEETIDENCEYSFYGVINQFPNMGDIEKAEISELRKNSMQKDIKKSIEGIQEKFLE